MGESSYAEVIVHDEKDVQKKQLGIGMTLITVLLLVYGAMFQAVVLTLGIILVPVTVIMIKNHYREYEYLLVSGELEISVVKNRSRRKKLRSYTLSEMQCMAPIKSHRLDAYHNNPQLKVYDFSSGNEGHDIYGMIFASQGMLQELKVEPTQAMLEEIRLRHASALYMD